MSKKIQIKLPETADRQYDVVIGTEVIRVLMVEIKKQNISNVVVITDSNVKKLYGDDLLKNVKPYLLSCLPAGKAVNCYLLSFPAGEKNKNQKTKTRLEEEMLKLGCGRDSLVIALGGGVVGDMAGFVAATYMRGVPYLNIPTTLLSMVDSSVGGKTAIDTEYGKNMIGAFHQPGLVLINTNFLTTLPKRQIKNGLVEVLKIFLTNDKQMVDFVESNLSDILSLDKELVEKVIERSIKIKSDIVVRDEKETGERAILNFGHTIGHAIEKLSGYKLLHGEAVALGILVEAKISQIIGKLPESVYNEIENVIKKIVDIDLLRNYDINNIIKQTKLDKKAEAGMIKYVLLKDIGIYCKEGGKFSHVVDDKIVIKSLKYFV